MKHRVLGRTNGIELHHCATCCHCEMVCSFRELRVCPDEAAHVETFLLEGLHDEACCPGVRAVQADRGTRSRRGSGSRTMDRGLGFCRTILGCRSLHPAGADRRTINSAYEL